MGTRESSFWAPLPCISGMRYSVSRWLGSKYVMGIKWRKTNHSITSSQFSPTRVSNKERVTVHS